MKRIVLPGIDRSVAAK